MCVSGSSSLHCGVAVCCCVAVYCSVFGYDAEYHAGNCSKMPSVPGVCG